MIRHAKIGRPPGARDRMGKAVRTDARQVKACLTTTGQRIRDKRLELDIGADELAAAIGGHPSTIYKIESGLTAAPALTTVIKIAIAFGLSPRELLP